MACFLKKYYLWDRKLHSVKWILFRANESQRGKMIFLGVGNRFVFAINEQLPVGILYYACE